jgi:PAS domain S-box-containing protein
MAMLVTAGTLLLAAVTLVIARRAAILDDALREQQQIYRAVLGNSLDAFIMIDQDSRVLDWNAQAEQVFGWSREEALGGAVDQLIMPESSREAHRTGLARFLETGEGTVILRRVVLTARRRSGEEFPAELIIVPIDTEGHWRFGGFVRDVSEQQATEVQLRHAQRLDAMGQLTGGVAHDLNNLLTVVIGNLDLLEREGDERTRRLAQPALQAAERGAALIHRLLAFARRQALAPRRIDMNALVTGMLELLRRTLGAEVEIKLELSDNLWPVHADPVQVENALLNLAVNARDAMQEAGGHLSIETANAHLDEDYAHSNPEVEPGDYVMLAVTDTGHGMTADVAERAVEPFFTTKEVGKGSGLGLSMVYGFAKQSRGHMKIYSEPDQGTTVRLYLPHQAPEPVQEAGSEPVRAQALGGGETILVVEDDPAVRGFVLAVVRTLGYRVLEAGDAGEALALLADHPDVDLLFTDVILPGGVSGRQLAESAERLRPGLKVLFTSGYTRNSVVHQGRLNHGVSFLAKPYKREELARKLREVLDAS